MFINFSLNEINVIAPNRKIIKLPPSPPESYLQIDNKLFLFMQTNGVLSIKKTHYDEKNIIIPHSSLIVIDRVFLTNTLKHLLKNNKKIILAKRTPFHMGTKNTYTIAPIYGSVVALWDNYYSNVS